MLRRRQQDNNSHSTRTWSTNYWTTLLYNLAHSAVVHFAFDGNSTDSLIVESILPSSDLVFPIGMAKAGFEAPMHDIYGPYHRAFSNPFKRIGDYGIGLDMSWKPVSIGIYAGAYFKSQEICFMPNDESLRGFYFQPDWCWAAKNTPLRPACSTTKW